MKTILVFIVLFFTLVYPWKESTTTIELNNIEAVFLNNPGDFTFLTKKGDEIEQKRYDNVVLHICDECFPYAIIVERREVNFIGAESVYNISVDLYLPSINLLQGGQTPTGKNRSNQTHKIFEK